MPKNHIPSIEASITYIDNDSLFHRWEPRTKTIAMVGSVFLISALNQVSLVIIAFLTLFIMVNIMGLRGVELVKKTSRLLPFIILMSIPIILGGGLDIDKERVNTALLLGFKGLSSLYLMFLLFYSQPLVDLLAALSYMKIPDTLMSVLFLTWRYVFILGEKLRRMYKALSARLFKPSLDRITFNTMGQIMGGTIIKSLDTSDTVYKAMQARGFTGKIPVSRPREIKVRDLLKTLGLIGFFIALIFIERWWF